MKKIASIFKFILGHSVTKNSTIVLIGSMIANFSAYLYHLIIGRILGPEKYGEIAALLSLFYILNVVSQGVQTVLTKYFSIYKARRQIGEAKGMFISATKWMLLIELLGFCGFFLLLNQLADFLHISSKLNFVWLYLIFTTYFISVVQLSVYQGYQLFFMQNILTNIGAVLRVALGTVGAFFGVGATLFSNVISNLIMYLVNFLPLGFLLKSDAAPVSVNKRNIVEYSVPALITTLGLTALYSQDVLFVKHFFLAREAGIYSALSILGKVIFYASSALGFVLFPVVAERSELKKEHRRIVWSGLGVIGVISLALTAFYFLFPQFVVDLFWGREFYEVIPYLGYFGLFITFFSLSSLLFSVCLAAERTTVWVFASAGALAQAALISLYHQTLLNIIFVNLAVSATLFFVLLLYYSYAKEPS